MYTLYIQLFLPYPTGYHQELEPKYTSKPKPKLGKGRETYREGRKGMKGEITA